LSSARATVEPTKVCVVVVLVPKSFLPRLLASVVVLVSLAPVIVNCKGGESYALFELYEHLFIKGLEPGSLALLCAKGLTLLYYPWNSRCQRTCKG
jgi:hypothetical protein